MTVVTSINFAEAFCFCDVLSGLHTVCGRYCSHLQHTEAEDNVEEMGAFEEDGALLIIAMMLMQSFRNDFLERTA